ncbi:MAG: hypothetical protein AB8B87_18915 [Granulosicoccus sp.]
MRLKKILLWLIALSGFHFNAVFAIETPDFVLNSGRWEQLVIPAESSNLTVRQLFADDLPAEGYDSFWVIYRYDGVTGQYVNPGIDGTITTGTGFWIIQLTDAAVVLDLPASIPAASTQASEACVVEECILTPLYVRDEQFTYSMLGPALASPSDVNRISISVSANNASCQQGCSLEEAAEQQYISSRLWHYNAASNTYLNLSVVGQFAPWQAVWMQARPSLSGTAEIHFPSSTNVPGTITERA